MKRILIALIVTAIAGLAHAKLAAELKLSIEGDKLWANIVVKQDGKDWKDGVISVVWTAPAGKYCKDSTIELRYVASNRYRTKAVRSWRVEIAGVDCAALCDGAWKVAVYSSPVITSGDLLACVDVTIDKEGKIVQSSSPIGAKTAQVVGISR